MDPVAILYLELCLLLDIFSEHTISFLLEWYIN